MLKGCVLVPRRFSAYSRTFPRLFSRPLNVMSDKIRQIIRSQWRLRNSRSPLVREEARNLIQVHVALLRGGKGGATRHAA